MPTLALSDVPIAVLLLFLSGSLINRLTSKGPMLWPVLGIVPTLFYNMSNIYEWATASAIRAGGTFPYRGVWFGRCHGFITVSPTNIEHMLKNNFPNYPKGRYYRERFADFLGDGIFNADDLNWRSQRRAAVAEMHSARFAEYSIHTIKTLTHSKLLPLLERLADRNLSVDLQEVFLRFTFDNICAAAFGVDPGCLAIDLPEVPFAKAFEDATELTLFRFTVPPFVWKPMKVFNVGTERRLRAAIRTVHEFAERTVAERRGEMGRLERCDLLSRLMEAKEKFSDRFLKDFCISFILAGRDTSSVALAWFFWLLSQHPCVERRILEELSEILGERKPKDVVFTVEELKRMEYLQAALSESLRLYPSVPVDFKEVVLISLGPVWRWSLKFHPEFSGIKNFNSKFLTPVVWVSK